jgi:hypothetical protein
MLIGIRARRLITHSRDSACIRHRSGRTVALTMVNPFNITSVYLAGIVWVLMLLYWICVCFYVFSGFNLFV